MTELIEHSRYQFLPDLLPEEYEPLKASIADRDVDVPIIVDQHGNIIDGFHRHRACGELNVICSQEVRHFATEAEKFELALRLNCRRRQLNRQQKRELIAAYLKRDPQIADNCLADLIGGVSKNTVADVRGGLEATCQIDKFEKLRGKDSKERPPKYKRIIANTAKEAQAAMQVIGDLPENCNGKILDATTAKRRANRNRRELERGQKRQQWADQPINNLTLREKIRPFHCQFQELEHTGAIQPESVHLVFCDIPYDKGFLPQVSELAAMAYRVLAPGGILAVMSGIYWEDETNAIFSQSFTRLHKLIAPWRGNGNVLQIKGMRVVNHYKPVLVYSKSKLAKTITIGNDMLPEADQEKFWHEWQQPLPQINKIIQYLSDENDIVLDACGGGFTTAIACRNHNRRFVGCDIKEHCVRAGQTRLRLAESLDEFIWNLNDMGCTVTQDSVLYWADDEGVDAECASHVFKDLPDELKALFGATGPVSWPEDRDVECPFSEVGMEQALVLS